MLDPSGLTMAPASSESMLLLQRKAHAAGIEAVLIEDHQVVCGVGSQISHALSQAGIPHQVKSLGIKGEFGQSAYLAEELYKAHGLTADRVIESAKQLLGK